MRVRMMQHISIRTCQHLVMTHSVIIVLMMATVRYVLTACLHAHFFFIIDYTNNFVSKKNACICIIRRDVFVLFVRVLTTVHHLTGEILNVQISRRRSTVATKEFYVIFFLLCSAEEL